VYGVEICEQAITTAEYVIQEWLKYQLETLKKKTKEKIVSKIYKRFTLSFNVDYK